MGSARRSRSNAEQASRPVSDDYLAVYGSASLVLVNTVYKHTCQPLKNISWTLGTIFRDSQEFSGISGSAMDPELLALDSDIFSQIKFCKECKALGIFHGSEE